MVAKNGMSVRKGHTLLANLVSAGEVPMGLTAYNYRPAQPNAQGAQALDKQDQWLKTYQDPVIRRTPR